MIYRFQSQQLISSPRDLAERQLKQHQEKGMQSNLSIYEVARLMDQIVFTTPSTASNRNQSAFDICFN